MNPKQAAPLLATLPALAAAAPPIIVGGLIGGAILFLLKALLSEDKQMPSEATSVEASKEARKPAETAVFRQIPATIPAAKLASTLLASVPRAIIPPPVVQLVPKASVPAIKSAAQVSLLPVTRKLVTREDLATVFNRGTRSLTRTAVVAALKRLGFGKTAAYAALTPDGRFAAWLHFAPDGLITWTDGHGT